MNTCRLVLSTSNGCVKSAANVPETKPDTNEIGIGPRARVVDNGEKGRGDSGEVRDVFKSSNEAQYIPEKGTSRQRVGPRPR